MALIRQLYGQKIPIALPVRIIDTKGFDDGGHPDTRFGSLGLHGSGVVSVMK